MRWKARGKRVPRWLFRVAGVVAGINVLVQAATASNVFVRVAAIFLLVVAGFFAGTLFYLVRKRREPSAAAPEA